MGRIEKVAGPKHESTLSEGISEYIQEILNAPVGELPSLLNGFDRKWPFPRGDLYHWIGVLNRFDEILAHFISEYELDKGPQTKTFGCLIVAGESNAETSDNKLEKLELSDDGDRELVEAILEFSQLLYEKCGNRALYNSSERLNALLNTTSLPLLHTTLRLGVCIAQRYYSRYQSPNHSTFHPTLLANHYDVELDRLHSLASPFPRPVLPKNNYEVSSTVKGKEKVGSGKESAGKCNANDFICLARGSADDNTVPDGSRSYEFAPDNWHDWGNVRLSYYPQASDRRQATSEGPGPGGEAGQPPTTPTPFRRTSSNISGRGSGLPAGDDTTPGTAQSSNNKADDASRGMKVLEIPASEISAGSLGQVLKDRLEEVPLNSRYELLHRLRVAYALSTSSETRQRILAIRLLAIINLAYVYPDNMFQQKVLQSDSDEPKRFQLAYQLAEYVHLGVAGDIPASTVNQTVALYCLDVLAKHKSRASDVGYALSINVNHGVLMFLVRKAVTDLATENGDISDNSTEGDEWREALFSLLRSLLASGSRTPETLISAGLIPMFVDMLNLRTYKTRRIYPRVLDMLDNFVHAVRDSLGTLASAKGFDALSDLISSESQSAFDLVEQGEGIPARFKTPSTDYQIPYFHQQSLRWLCKFVNHVMQHNNAGFERLLRNLIDSPPLLTALRLVLDNAHIFGSYVWSGVVNIMSHFIHNEPTSYAVIAEAGLSKSFLEAVMDRPMDEENDQDSIKFSLPFLPSKKASERGTLISRLVKSPERKGFANIIPSAEAIVCIPMAFGAISLNSSGLELFQSSDGLERFFDIFESPKHVKYMKSDTSLLRVLGNSFDELIRHHPPLKDAVMGSIIRMVARVGLLSKYKAWERALGMKLWVQDQEGKASIAGGPPAAIAEIGAEYTQNLEEIQATPLPGAQGLGSQDETGVASTYGELFGPPKVDEWNFKERDDDDLTAADYLFPVLEFLTAFFENQSLCSYFMECGGVEYVLDYATLQSIPFDFPGGREGGVLGRLLHLMAEAKPHLVLPSLVNRAENAVDKLEPFLNQRGEKGFFSPLTSATGSTSDAAEAKEKGTYFAKHLVTVLTLTDVLGETLKPFRYPTRPSQQQSAFNQSNLADKYAKIARKLGLLHATCVWEDILLQKELPDSWNEGTRPGGPLVRPDGNEAANTPNADNLPDGTVPSAVSGQRSAAEGSQLDNNPPANVEKGAAFSNVKILRYLLGALPSSITVFLHSLAHGFITKRRIDPYPRQNAEKVADAISAVMIEQLNFDMAQSTGCSQDRFSYIIVVLSSFSQLLFRATPENFHSSCLALVLQSFKKLNGLQTLRDLSAIFLHEIKNVGVEAKQESPPKEVSTRLASAYGGLKIILNFFSETTRNTYITESIQAQALANSHSGRDRPDAFNSSQFLVEMRMTALKLVQEMWGTSFVDEASSSIIRSLVSILRTVLDGAGEEGAYHRGSVPRPGSPPSSRSFLFHRDRLNTLIERGFDETLSKEALYRCNNGLSASEEYCAAQQGARPPPRNPLPSDELDNAPPRVSSPEQSDLFSSLGESARSRGDSTAPTPIQSLDPATSFLESIQGAQREGGTESASGLRESSEARAEDRTDGTDAGEEGTGPRDSTNSEQQPNDGQREGQEGDRREVVTAEDLDDERDKIRSNLIERCLDVLNVHHDITFELSELINSATSKHRDQTSFRREIGETLMHFLISLQMDENFEAGGKKIAAYANLLALVLQDSDIYAATLDELKENFSVLLGFIKLPPSISDKPTEETSPWIGQVLLIMERILSDDAQPPYFRSVDPDTGKPESEDEPAQLPEPIISSEDKMNLFESIVEVMPRVGKAESLALSICRILVILTRQRTIAVQLAKKTNLQRLFVMIKQVASTSSDKLQGAFMVILRHIIEDDETIRQIMRSEITSSFDSRGRHMDVTSYLRQFHHLALRSPQLFVEVTNDTLKLHNYDSHHPAQQLVIKSEKKRQGETRGEELSEPTNPDSGETQERAAEQKSGKEAEDGDVKEAKERAKATELKPPVVENPDGVIHYILSELLSYRDVDDKEQTSNVPEKDAEDMEMSTEESATATVSDTRDGSTKKTEKPSFKAEAHPIYVYRCFLLQCLTELLSSYNRTKVEFINFSRKADPLATTPSKPRSGVLNYLLHGLIPIGTMERDDSIAFKKRVCVSNWAMRVTVALCTKTGEIGGASSRRRPQAEEDDEPDLLFVRRFVLEHALRSFKEAGSSQEPLDSKYARLMCLADLFDKMLSGPSASDGTATFPSSSRQIAKTMFEKNFIAAFTSAIADVDLNFPSSNRAVKYILRPLNKLTQTAIVLSETTSLSSAYEQTDEDEISSATSVTDVDDGREETPDLFRHSTLGMLEPDSEEPSSSEGSEEGDDEMYDDEYDDEHYDDEEMHEDDGEVVSEDEDERGPIEGLPGDEGMDVEVLLESGEDEDDDDDEDEEDDQGDDHSELEDEIMAGEITGDRENDSLHGVDEGEWESEDFTDDGNDALMNHLEHHMGDFQPGEHDAIFEHQPQFDSLLRVLEQAGGTVERIESDMDMGRDMQDDMMDEDEMHDEDDEDIDELEDEMVDLEDEPDDGDDMHSPWGWDEPMAGHGRPPTRAPPLNILPGGNFGRRQGGLLPIGNYRSHNNTSARDDDGVNPLLRRTDEAGEQPSQFRGPSTEVFSDWVQAMGPRGQTQGQGRLVSVDSPVTFMNAIMQVIGQGGPGFGVVSRPDGFHVHLDRGALPQHMQDMFGVGRAQQAPPAPRARDDPAQAVTFVPTTTSNRWQEEARLLFANAHLEKAQRLVNSILRVLIPPAIEEEKERQKREEAERKRLEEERAERERQERIAKEEAEREQKRKEEEEEALRQQQEAERASEEASRQPVEPDPMDDVQPTEQVQAPEPAAEEETAQPGPSEPQERVHTTIRGRQVDITGMDIDPEYLEALPEEIREEVIMQQLAEQRSHAAAAGEEPSEINPEFLDALPREIREELLQQEAADRRRRERESTRQQAAANGTPHAEDMDPASFIATLDPSLRQTVLADQPDDVLASLGPEFVSEARALSGRRLHQFDMDNRAARNREEQPQEEKTKKSQRRPVVQLLDKAGVATLLRLMFLPMPSTARHHLNDILHNVCQNRQNRVEVISLLLLILQDGSADVSAVERSFAHLSLRARTPTSQKTPQSAKRSLPLPSPGSGSDVTPLMVIQQCLSALSFLTQYNPHIAWFFLTEHETSAALKLKALRKGKHKEDGGNKFALNSLLSLLDRKAILDSPSCMEQLSSLLSSVTQPLAILLRKEKEKEESKAENREERQAEAQTEGDRTDTTMADAGNAETPQNDALRDDEGHASSSKPSADEQKPKKQRTIEPPVIPELNLQLVVRILAARECGGKTFKDTLSTINNLSAVPKAKEVFGKELINQAKALSQTVLTDLENLLPYIQQAQKGTDVQGMALSKFSPSGSDQAKLLRVLTALDYLFDPTRADESKSDTESWEKEDVLGTLYENATFGPLWSKLSGCLTIIQQKENMLNVATILLPLIESLMVVCKNTTLKDVPSPRQRREFAVSSPPPESGMEGLFFQFTEDHRKVLNDLVRQNPRLMSGTFSILVKNPKVLEFDNKRNYFNRRLHSRGTETRHPHPPLQLSVRRDQVFLDSFKSLYFKSAEEMKYGKLSVRFHGEEGVDAGGVTREWFQVLARGMFNPNYALFIPVASDRTTFHPNRLSGVNQEHLMFFKFIGRIIGKALYEGRVLDCHFSRAVYKRILGRSVSIKDMETLDLDYYKSLLWMLENDITDIITETFSVEVEDFGETQVIDLVENGRNIPVTQENKEEYVQLVVEYRLTGSVKEQLDNFLKGFHDIISADLISIFNEQELELLISGLPEIDVDEWKNNTEYHNYSASSSQIQWFWRAVRSFGKEERAKLLQFVTGTSKVPLNGFKELEGMNGFSRFNIHRDYGNKDRLPSSHTCFNQLDLPEYDSYETLRQRLYTAMTAGSEYFGFA